MSVSTAPTTFEEDRLWTVQDVMELLQVSRRTVERLIENGELRAIKFGRNVRFRREDVNEFLERNTVGG